MNRKGTNKGGRNVTFAFVFYSVMFNLAVIHV